MDYKRISVKHKNPNPLFEEWITEWFIKAKGTNSNMRYTLKIALDSLRKYPIPLQTGRECLILKGFGSTLCKMLDDKLKYHKIKNKDTIVDPNKQFAVQSISITPKKSPGSKEYIPAYRSGAYAIMIAMYEKQCGPNYPGFLHKKEIIEAARFLTDRPFEAPLPGSRYTAWSSMGKLIERELVQKTSNPAKFSLTEKGVKLGRQMYDTASLQAFEPIKDIASTNENEPVTCSPNILSLVTGSSTIASIPKAVNNRQKVVSNLFGGKSKETIQSSQYVSRNPSSCSVLSEKSVAAEETCIFLPNNFDIILYVDTQEVAGKNRQHDIIDELHHLIVKCETKNLKVGDFTWVCRDRDTKKELVLPYIVERKRMDDFAKSIKDGRYNEQKFRLKKCGIENIVYLIESYGKNDTHLGLPLATLMQAATNTALRDKFGVKFTGSRRETAQYLAGFSKKITNLFQSKTVISCPKDNLTPIDFDDDLLSLMSFEEFNKSSVKNKRPKVSDLFVKSLVQIKGMSVDRALAITELYPTPNLLYKAYNNCSAIEGEKLLSNIKFGQYNKCIGKILSITVYKLFINETFN